MWFSVRHVLKNGSSYEERITTWEAEDFEAASTLARAEAEDYATLLHDGIVLDLVQAYALAEAPGHRAEVFSLIRQSDLPPDEYLTTFFDTGSEFDRPL